jgi:hypothetical protein
MQALRAGALTKDANRAGGLYEVFHSFHAACYLYMTKQWKLRGLGIQDFGFLKKEIETLAQRKPQKLIKMLQDHERGQALPGLEKGGKDFVTFG